MGSDIRCIDASLSPSENGGDIEHILSGVRGIPVVYFVGFRECVKIGHYTNVAGRFRALNILPEPLAIFHLERGSRDDEAQYHHDFRQYRIYSEWFEHRGKLADFIAQKRHPIVFES